MSLIKFRYATMLAMIVTFLFLISYANAYEYAACPYSAQVENGYWNPDSCAGGLHGPGSLTFRFPDAPSTDDSVLVTSAILSFRASSPESYVYVQVWNGRTWYTVTGLIVDSTSYYDIDLTNLLGTYYDGSTRIRVGSNGPEALVIKELALEIQHESNEHTLTVLVKDCESGDRLESVEVEANGETVLTDYDGMAEFTLTKDRSYGIMADSADYHEQGSGVYLDSDKQVDICLAKHRKPGVMIDSLDVYRRIDVYSDDDDEIDVISFYLENTGNFEETIFYDIIVNDDVIITSHVMIEQGDASWVTEIHDFMPGKNVVKVIARSFGVSDIASTTYCVAGLTDNYRCSGTRILRERVSSGCGVSWEEVDQCPEACSLGVCTGYDGSSQGSCDVGIAGLLYADNVVEDESQTIGVRVANRDDSLRNVGLELYVDDAFQERETISLSAGETGTGYLQYVFYTPGTHVIRIDEFACGRVADSVTEQINVMSGSQSTGPGMDDRQNAWLNDVPASPTPTPEPDTGQAFPLEIFPDEVSLSPLKATGLKVSVPAGTTGDYSVSVAGMDSDRLDYPATVNFDNSKFFYVFVIAPEENGDYEIIVSIIDDGTLVARSSALLTVDGPVPAGADQPWYSNPATGLAMFAQSDEWVIYLVLGTIITTILVILILRWNSGRSSDNGTKDVPGKGNQKAGLPVQPAQPAKPVPAGQRPMQSKRRWATQQGRPFNPNEKPHPYQTKPAQPAPPFDPYSMGVRRASLR